MRNGTLPSPGVTQEVEIVPIALTAQASLAESAYAEAWSAPARASATGWQSVKEVHRPEVVAISRLVSPCFQVCA